MEKIIQEIGRMSVQLHIDMEDVTDSYIVLAEKIWELLQNIYGEEEIWLPIKIAEVAKNMGVAVEEEDLNGDGERRFSRVLGRIVTKNGETKITVDKNVGDKTRRYATAHAIARYLLNGGESVFESTYAIPLIPQNIDEIEADVVALLLLLPIEPFQKEFQEYLVKCWNDTQPLDVDAWMEYLSDTSGISLFNLSIGYQQLKQILGHKRHKQMEAVGFDFMKLEEDVYRIIYA